MHLPEIDKYAHLKSSLHSWDARFKLVSFFCLVTSISLLPNFLLSSFGLVLSIGLLFISKIPLKFVFLYLRWVLLFAGFFLIIMPITTPGNEVARLAGLKITQEGIDYGLLIALKAISCTILIFPMIGTSRFNQVIQALQQLRLPNKLVQLILFTYRYIFVMMEELRKMLIAAHSRLFQKKRNIYTLKILGNLLGMLFVRSFERTQWVYNAMVSRGYDGKLKTLTEFRFLLKDLLKAGIIIGAALGLHVLRIIL